MTTITLPKQDGRGWEQRTIGDDSTPTRPDDRRWLLGLDLGRMHDYTAAIAIERVEPPAGHAVYSVRQILRVRNRPYPDIVAAVQQLLAGPDLRGATLVVDGTGAGMAVVDMFRATGTSLVGITITAGFEHESVMGGYHVPKRELVSVTEVLLQQGRLRIAADLPHVRTLTEELSSFEVHISAAGRDTYSARVGEHDDLVLALAMACWFGESVPRVRFI